MHQRSANSCACVKGMKFLAGMAMGVFLVGCPNPQTYGTPRTTPAGKIQHTVAIEGLHASATQTLPATPATPTTPASAEREETSSVTIPMLPTYQLRVGVADRVDIGARITNISALGADVKWNFLKSQNVDLAVAPNIQVNYFSANGATIFILHGHLPLLFGYNFNESSTLVLAGGLSTAYASGSATGDAGTRTVASGGNIGARAGLGLQFRVSKKFALHPEITGIKFFNDQSNLWVVFGLGFNFGHLPSYAPGSENDEFEEEKPRQPTSPASAPAPEAPPATPASTISGTST